MNKFPEDIYTEPEPDVDTLANLGPLTIPGQAEPFRHTDRNTLRKIGEPTPNPTAQAAAKELKG